MDIKWKCGKKGKLLNNAFVKLATCVYVAFILETRNAFDK